jgi:hypothetical protein
VLWSTEPENDKVSNGQSIARAVSTPTVRRISQFSVLRRRCITRLQFLILSVLLHRRQLQETATVTWHLCASMNSFAIRLAIAIVMGRFLQRVLSIRMLETVVFDKDTMWTRRKPRR